MAKAEGKAAEAGPREVAIHREEAVGPLKKGKQQKKVDTIEGAGDLLSQGSQSYGNSASPSSMQPVTSVSFF